MTGWRAGAALAALVLVGGASSARAAGFEKAVMWSAPYGGIGGAAAGWVQGPESLFFNPAGLAHGDYTLGVSLNYSPTFDQFKGPIFTPEKLTSETGYKSVYGALASFKPLPRLGVGLGTFVSGGTNSVFKNVALPGFTLTPTFRSELSIIDFSAGIAYEVLDGLRIGGAWRATYVSAHLETAAPLGGPPPAALVSLDLHGLTDWSYDGFRVGAQYSAPGDAWGLGLNWRTPVTFRAEGTRTETFEAPPGSGPRPAGDAPVAASAQFPSQISAGGFLALLDRRLRLFLQYDFVHYAVDRQLTFEGTVVVPGAPPTAAPIPPIVFNWSNQHNARIGAEWTGFENWVVRGGYVFTSQVTNEKFARATIASPGIGSSILVGGGWRTLGGRLLLDATGEISWASGNGTNEFGRTGDFSTIAYVLHLTAGWRM